MVSSELVPLLTAIAGLVTALTWPVLGVIILLLFRTPILSLARRIASEAKNLSFGSFTVEFERRLEKAEKDERESAERQYDHERTLYVLASRMKTESRRQNKTLAEVPLEIGSKRFPESRILAELMYLTLESKLPLSKPDNRPRITVQESLRTFLNLRLGIIDVYVEYSGVGLMLAGQHIGEHVGDEARKVLNGIYSKWDLKWLEPLGFENREELVIRRKTAEEYGIKTLSDLAENSRDLVFGAYRGFFIREYLFPRLEGLGAGRTKLSFKKVRNDIDIDDRFTGLLKKEFDVGVGWTTDPEMDRQELQRVSYDKVFTPINQWAMPLCRKDVSKEIEKELSHLQISEGVMRELNTNAQKGRNTPDSIVGAATEAFRSMRN